MKNKSLKKFDLTKKTSIITGGAGILGSNFSRVLGENGSNIVIIDINKNAIEETIVKLENTIDKNKILGIKCDITKESDIKLALKKIIKKFGKVDILINNAATKTKNLKNFFDDFENYKLTVWNEVMSVNIDSMFLMSKLVGKQMLKQNTSCSIIQVSSIYGLLAPDQRIYENSNYMNVKINTPAVYSVSKSAVIGLSKYLASYWGHKGIRVNTLIPGGVESGQNEEFKKNYSYRVPLRRMAKASEMESTILFLASDASSYITGQNFIVDGGLSCW